MEVDLMEWRSVSELTQEELLEMDRLYSQGVSLKDLRRRFKVRIESPRSTPAKLSLVNGKHVWGSPHKDWESAVQRYKAREVSLQEIATEFGISRGAVWKKFKRMGIETSKAIVCWVDVSCGYCEKALKRTRKRARKVNRHFCDQFCYGLWIKHHSGSKYSPSRVGQRIGRGKVEGLYGPLPEGSVVHHRDGDCLNNDISNLMLFKDNGDHVRWHRDCREGVQPLWVWEEDL
jgi:hypothetical protein